MRKIAAGLLAVAVAVAVGHLIGVWIDPQSSPVVAVGDAIVDHTPTAVREWAIRSFGTGDKAVLFTGIGLVMVVLAALCGAVERRRWPWGSALIVGAGIFGLVCALSRPTATGVYAMPTVLATAVGLLTLRGLLGWLGTSPAADPAERRRFLTWAAGVGVIAVAALALSKVVDRGLAKVRRERDAEAIPPVADPVPAIDPNATVPQVIPFITSNADFYRIDTALTLPAVSTTGWKLRIHGEVDHPYDITWDELRREAALERAVTLSCVSNEVGGDLIGNAVWRGYLMKPLLERAAPRPGADMLLSTSADGWTCGTPISAITDGRDSILAVAMNGEPLPIAHGYPVRQVVPGLYGYVSATKWVVDWEITSFGKAKGYWSTRGWSEFGPIKVQSRIDRPSDSSVAAGEVIVAGTAWAVHTGIAKVEVRVDDGPWQQATVAPQYSLDTWRQWWFRWQATGGEHTITCRATDARGVTQTPVEAPPAPNGATGWDRRTYQVR